MRKKLTFLLTLITACIGLYAFMPVDVITVKGSDTMVILAQKWAETYQSKNSGVSIRVTGGGSGTGISALINGTTDICNSSRPMTKTEKQQLKNRYGSPGVEVRVAKDGITIYVHPSNGVSKLSIGQLKGIYMGTITNWSQVGGKNARIIVYGRENSSGTYAFFKEHVLGGYDFGGSVQTLPGTAAVVNAVAKDPNGIGYGGFGYAKGIKVCQVSTTDGGAGIMPSDQTINNGSYPISRYLYIYLKNRPTGALKSYVDWIISAEGQSVVKKTGYFPL
ncbi:MAG: phosphate ABC transporter substrate-binding protein [Armatimonadetes bacterium]|nr:phosphate ABC transporter substrate-binding protein [Armatimonadota bacterium]